MYDRLSLAISSTWAGMNIKRHFLLVFITEPSLCICTVCVVFESTYSPAIFLLHFKRGCQARDWSTYVQSPRHHTLPYLSAPLTITHSLHLYYACPNNTLQCPLSLCQSLSFLWSSGSSSNGLCWHDKHSLMCQSRIVKKKNENRTVERKKSIISLTVMTHISVLLPSTSFPFVLFLPHISQSHPLSLSPSLLSIDLPLFHSLYLSVFPSVSLCSSLSLPLSSSLFN